MSIIVKELSKIYGSGENRVTALDRASMEICDRDFISIVGPSGSGKSTLLHLISGLDRPTSGTVLYDGKDIHSGSDRVLSAFRRRNIGFIFQQFNLLRSQNQIDSFRIQNITLHIFDHITQQLIETHLDQTILYFFSTIMFHQFSGI